MKTGSEYTGMGGPCWLIQPNGRRIQGPACTDNFQICSFIFDGTAFHSVEQAFQSLKFERGSSTSASIRLAQPRADESASAYGMRMWQSGQSRADPLINNFEDVKVALMYVLNCAKFASNPSLQTELLSQTHDLPIDGGASTWEWQKWNGLIHMLLRDRIQKGADLEAEMCRDFANPSEAAKIMGQMQVLRPNCLEDGSRD